MKCKTFKIHLQEEAGNFEEMKFNKFLETVTLSQIFASVVNNEFWSVVVFYEEGATTRQSFAKTQRFCKSKKFSRTNPNEDFQPVKTFG
jgi:hypothetical protein